MSTHSRYARDFSHLQIRQDWYNKDENQVCHMHEITGQDLPVIPESQIEPFVMQSHEDHMNPHNGRNKITARIKQYAWFPNVDRRVDEMLRKCGICAQ